MLTRVRRVEATQNRTEKQTGIIMPAPLRVHVVPANPHIRTYILTHIHLH